VLVLDLNKAPSLISYCEPSTSSPFVIFLWVPVRHVAISDIGDISHSIWYFEVVVVVQIGGCVQDVGCWMLLSFSGAI
jgi:hypothetical protein